LACWWASSGAYAATTTVPSSWVCADGLVVRVLRLTSLDLLLPVHATLADALGGDAGQAEDRSGAGADGPELAPG
jgi:hypothetical protein